MRSTESGFSERIYFEAAKEHMARINQMLVQSAPDYVLISYLAGVAVESLFHAYRMRSGVEDTAKHDLRIHANSSGFYEGMTLQERQRMSEELSEVVIRWQNNHRYRSEEALRAFIRKHKLYIINGTKTTRQDALQFNAQKLVEAMDRIITSGVLRWTR